MSTTGIKKLQEEYKFIRKKGILAQIGGGAAPINKNFLHWRGCVEGPKNSPYSGGLFYFEMKFPENYPNSGPIDVQMRTPIYHPNISNKHGHICVSYLNNWENTNDVVGIVNAIFDLLYESNPDDGYHGIDSKKAEEFKNKYATLYQNIDWNNSWDKGWTQ